MSISSLHIKIGKVEAETEAEAETGAEPSRRKRKFKAVMKFTAITENHLYRKAYKSGKRFGADSLSVYILKDRRAGLLRKQHPEKKTVNRIGISASKKIGGAVQRNRAKRVIREAWRQIDKSCGIKTGWLVVLVPRTSCTVMKMQDVMRDLQKCLAKAELLVHTPDTARKHTPDNEVSE